jgi:hypothetical protein
MFLFCTTFLLYYIKYIIKVGASPTVISLNKIRMYCYSLLVFKHNFYLTYLSTAVLPVMLSSKLLPEMEIEETTKRETLLSGITNLPVPTQIEKLKVIKCSTKNANVYHIILYSFISCLLNKMGLDLIPFRIE